jgi:hypothetical protein
MNSSSGNHPDDIRTSVLEGLEDNWPHRSIDCLYAAVGGLILDERERCAGIVEAARTPDKAAILKAIREGVHE